MNSDKQSYNAYMKEYMLRRYQGRRSMAISRLGGKCLACGATEGLELDHIERSSKSFTIAKLWNKPMAEFLAEVDKCQLLCDPCHNRKTLREKGQLPAKGTHGTLSGLRYCKPPCEACRVVRNEANRDWKRKSRGSSPRRTPIHGEMAMYQRGCRCSECRVANTEKARAFRRSKLGVVADAGPAPTF